MSTLQIILAILGSNVLTAIITIFAKRGSEKAGTIKLKNESGQLVLEGELKLTGFYKDQLEVIISKYNLLEKKFDEKIKENIDCNARVHELEAKCLDLQLQITKLSMRLENQE